MRLRDLGNTVLVVEHDEDTIRAADYVIDMGPRAGVHGGRIVAAGTPDDISRQHALADRARTCRARKRSRCRSQRRQSGNRSADASSGARGHNLQQRHGRASRSACFTCVTGVSGSGKSTLVIDTLLRALAQQLHQRQGAARARTTASTGCSTSTRSSTSTRRRSGARRARTRRRTPACSRTSAICSRSLPESKARGYKPGRYSFNVKGGRCEACQGDGILRIEMHFLPDVYVECEACGGRRYNRETLEVQLHGSASIADVLDMTVTQACEFLENIPKVRQKLETLREVGLGYIKLGQSATTLSGGEAQRIKLSKELAKKCDRADGLHPGRADHRPALRRHRAAAGGAEPAGRRRATPSSSSSTTWTSSRPPTGSSTSGPEGGPGRRPDRRAGHARRRRARRRQLHRPVPAQGAIAMSCRDWPRTG